MGNVNNASMLILEVTEVEYRSMHNDDLSGVMAVVPIEVCVGDCCSSSSTSKAG